MKTLFLLLHLLLCQWVVAFDDANRNVGIENVGDADGEVLFALTGDKLPLAIEAVGLTIDHTDAAFSGLVLPDETNIKVGAAFFDDTNLAVKTTSNREGSVYSILPVTGEPVVLEVNLRPWPGLSEAGHGHREEGDYEEQPFHAANIAII